MEAVAESLLKSGEVSAMIRQGFISSPRLSPISSPPPTPPATVSGSSAVASVPSPPRPSLPAPRTTTLFEMITQEAGHRRPPLRPQQLDLQERIAMILASKGPSDVKLSVSSGNGMRIRMAAHRQVLTARSRFFAEKLVGICCRPGSRPVVVEICECDDAEVYVEAVGLMYSDDLRRMLAGENVSKVLGLFQVSVDIKFDEGISACLEYLEAIPWSEYEEEKVISILGKLHIQQLREPIREIFQRVSVQPSAFANADSIFLGILDGVLQSKDKKARRDIKTLISGLLKEDVNQSNIQYNKLDVSKDSLYYLCQKCLDHLMQLFSEAANIENVADRASLMGEVAREADNVQWLVDILINKRIADEFVALWADQGELSTCHSKIPCMYRFEISRITAQLCVAIGRGHILVSKDAKISLLRTWLEALYDDFGWMKRACRDFDKKMVEDGICATVLTLPMAEQQSILLRWFDCFLNNGDNCPNMQRAFVVWWRRAFVRQYQGDQANLQLQNVVYDDHT
ncbi:BTB/POZ domain-containing protein At5g60050-like [Curcuma longa]|uniref:BTB/POZ domain-containing protein At5g60050-like n=1 Tax=Curcuma longa TaxID=136217 RepID=UPI003D9F5601